MKRFYDLVLSHFTNKTKSLAKAFKKGRQNQGIITCVYIFASVNRLAHGFRYLCLIVRDVVVLLSNFFFFVSFTFLGIPVDLHSPDSLNCLLPSKVANQALKRALNAQEPEDSLTEEDLALAASLEYVITYPRRNNFNREEDLLSLLAIFSRLDRR